VRRLTFIRLQRGLTARQVAAAAKLTAPILSNIERGRVNPNARELAALSRVLGCPPDRLMDVITTEEYADVR
jgi:transcriptional regulator with XRE-family HTH domain